MKTALLFLLILIIELGVLFYAPIDSYLKEKVGDIFTTTVTPNSQNFTLDEYYQDNRYIDAQVERAYQELSPRQRISELFMPAVGSRGITKAELEVLIKTDSVGGFMVLGDGVNKDDIAAMQNIAARYRTLPLFVSIDAEPSLAEERIPDVGIQTKATAQYKSDEEISYIAGLISTELTSRGFNINFAPVYDTNQNQAIIGSRSFSNDPTLAGTRANIFSKTTMTNNVVPVAKHFPGHGAVQGDSHMILPVVSETLPELPAFKLAIEAGVPMIMIGHLAVLGGEFGTDGKPATVSPNVMKKLLRDNLGFQGVIITDAFNMGAVDGITGKEVLSIQSGADIVLMPEGSITSHIDQILAEIQKDPIFAREVEEKIKRVLRLKILLQ